MHYSLFMIKQALDTNPSCPQLNVKANRDQDKKCLRKKLKIPGKSVEAFFYIFNNLLILKAF